MEVMCAASVRMAALVNLVWTAQADVVLLARVSAVTIGSKMATRLGSTVVVHVAHSVW